MATRGLLMAANYTGTQHELQGCVNDAENLRDFLTSTGRISAGNLTLIKEPTAAQMVQALESLAEESHQKQVDHVFISFSGHGTSMADRDGDEADGQDEALVPVDFRTSGMVTDDQLCKIIANFDPTTNISILFDCCHSGTALDLPYRFTGCASTKYCGSGSRSHPRTVMISGCMDAQTSADAYDVDRREYSGAMTSSILDVLDVEPTIGFDAFGLVTAMRVLLKERNMSQVPQLCASRDCSECPMPAFFPPPQA